MPDEEAVQLRTLESLAISYDDYRNEYPTGERLIDPEVGVIVKDVPLSDIVEPLAFATSLEDIIALAANIYDVKKKKRPGQINGQLEPIRLIRLPDGSLHIVDGFHRAQAILFLNKVHPEFSTVFARIFDGDPITLLRERIQTQQTKEHLSYQRMLALVENTWRILPFGEVRFQEALEVLRAEAADIRPQDLPRAEDALPEDHEYSEAVLRRSRMRNISPDQLQRAISFAHEVCQGFRVNYDTAIKFCNLGKRLSPKVSDMVRASGKPQNGEISLRFAELLAYHTSSRFVVQESIVEAVSRFGINSKSLETLLLTLKKNATSSLIEHEILTAIGWIYPTPPVPDNPQSSHTIQVQKEILIWLFGHSAKDTFPYSEWRSFLSLIAIATAKNSDLFHVPPEQISSILDEIYDQSRQSMTEEQILDSTGTVDPSGSTTQPISSQVQPRSSERAPYSGRDYRDQYGPYAWRRKRSSNGNGDKDDFDSEDDEEKEDERIPIHPLDTHDLPDGPESNPYTDRGPASPESVRELVLHLYRARRQAAELEEANKNQAQMFRKVEGELDEAHAKIQALTSAIQKALEILAGDPRTSRSSSKAISILQEALPDTAPSVTSGGDGEDIVVTFKREMARLTELV